MKKKLLLKRLDTITYIFIIITILMVILTPCFIYFNSKYKIVNTINKENIENDIF